jgi:RHS repeat-associated protein
MLRGKRLLVPTLFYFLFSLSAPSAHAQDDPMFEAGVKPYGTYNQGTVDTVDLLSGNLTVDIPLMSYPQRGGKLGMNFIFHYQSGPAALEDFCDGEGDCTTVTGPFAHGPYLDQSGGWGGGGSDNVNGNVYVSISAVMPSGQLHQFGPTTNGALGGPSDGCPQAPWRSLDGSGYLLTWDTSCNPTLTDADGTRFSFLYANSAVIPGINQESNLYATAGGSYGWSPAPTKIEDTNGNEITATYTSGSGPSPDVISGWTDSLGRSISPPSSDSPTASDPYPCPTVSGQPTVSSSWLWPFLGPNGGTYPVKFCAIGVSESYVYWDPNLSEYNTYSTTAPEIQSIVLPNGTSWQFTYDTSTGSGNLLQITYPTGGTISYEWTSNPFLTYTCAFECYGSGVMQRTLGGVTTPGVWTYGYSHSSTTNYGVPVDFYTTVTDPMGNNVVHTFASLDPYTQFETETQYYQSASTLLKTVNTTYQDSKPFDSSSNWPLYLYALGVEPTQVTTTWAATSQESEVTYSYDSALKFYFPEYLGATFKGGSSTWTGTLGAKLTESDYDYGSGAPGSLLRTTTSVFEYTASASYLNNNLLQIPYSVQVKNGSGTQVSYSYYGYDEYSLTNIGAVPTQHDSSPPAGTYRGNATSLHHWLNDVTASTTNCPISVSNGYLVSFSVYNDTGTKDHTVDSCGSSSSDANHKTAYSYSSTYVGALPTTVMNALGQTTTYTYDFNTGLATSAEDPNSQTTTTSYDYLLRLSQVIYPDSGEVTYCYTDEPSTSCSASGPPEVIITDKITTSGLTKTQTAVLDGLGRVVQKQLNSNPGCTVYVNYTYDPAGRRYSVSNPFCSSSDPTYGITTTLFDALGRKCLLVPADATAPSGYNCPTSQPTDTVFTTYSGNATTVTDEAGKTRKSATNALDWLTDVWEDPNELDYHTTYTYDALGDLLTASQGGTHTRTFVYDSLKHLMQSTNPETGMVCYGVIQSGVCELNGYDADGNVITKSDTRPVTITYSYDYLNRITGRSYSNGDTSIGYSYDGSSCLGLPNCYNIGRRTGMTDAGGSEYFAYDPMGREWAEQRTTGTVTLNTGYTYNIDGSFATIAYPSGRTITYTPDSVGRPSLVQDVADSITYVSGTCANGNGSSSAVCYAPTGAIASITSGSNLYSTYYYNNRLQPCRIAASAGGTPPTSCTDTTDIGNALDLTYNFDLGSADNTDVYEISNNRDNNRSQSFAYDDLNRLTTGQSTGTYSTDPGMCWGEMFYFDNSGTTNSGEFGNLTSVGAMSGYSGCTQDGLNVTATSNNQISATGMSYDSAGNVLSDGANSYTWNSESEIKTAAGYTYTYDGDGNRLEKSTGELYWYGAGTEVLDESNSAGIDAEYVYFRNTRIAQNIVSGGSITGTYFYAADFLGSSRTIVESGATSPCFDADFLPFGREKDATTSCTQNNYKFEGKERDSETGNDNFGARYYSSNFGRWLSPDWSSKPAPVPYADLTNPQTLNLYAMVHNNPESSRDLDGHQNDHPNECNVETEKGCDEEQDSFIFQVARLDITLTPAELAAAVNFQDTPSQPRAFAPTSSDKLHDAVNRFNLTLQAQHYIQTHPMAKAVANGAINFVGNMLIMALTADLDVPETIAAAPKLVDSAEGATTAIQPMADAAFGTGTIRNVAGYEVGGNAGLVGQTYNVNIWGLYATQDSEGAFAFVNALKSEASAAGASEISITGNAVVNQSLLNISPAAAGRLGLEVQQVNTTTILLRGTIP